MDNNHTKENQFRVITKELWDIQTEMNALRSRMWSILHTLGRALEEIDIDEQ